MKKIFTLIMAILLSLSVARADAQPVKKTTNPILRVLVLDNKESVLLAIKGGYRIYSTTSDKLLTGGYILHTIVSASDQGIMFGQRDLKFSKIRVVVPESSYVYIDGRAFRGSVDIIRKENMKLMVINRVPLEEYLYGVLYNEVSHRWPIEAIKAQAVTARTFALHQARQNKLQDYDLTNDIYSQVYSGAASERWSTTRAVKMTSGQILTCKGDIFPAYYHATCGGHTEDASNLWNIDLPCLKGVECGYCKESPHYKWTKTMTLADVEKKLNGGGYKLGKIKDISIVSKNNSGRIDKIEIKDEAGVSYIVTAKDFRHIIGPNEVRSTNFDVSINGDKLTLKGIGWGHGVGMCQWGAKGLSEKGKTCKEILDFYYPGAQITTIDKIADKL
ncbi:MAG: SpoIID/LytB domain-containing protein [Candidatus Omnitrophota bacterium]|jgi:stage II sporulation protein D